VVREANISAGDWRRRWQQLRSGDDDVQNSTTSVGLLGLHDRKAIPSEEAMKLASVRIVLAIEADVEVASDVDWFTKRCDHIENG
jgi:hypothetical protein